MILEGDAAARKDFRATKLRPSPRFTNHMILPLASRRDRITQIRWGIADYEKTMGASPEGIVAGRDRRR